MVLEMDTDTPLVAEGLEWQVQEKSQGHQAGQEEGGREVEGDILVSQESP